MDNRYVSEENYKKGIKFLKKLRIISIIVYLCLLFIGVSLIVFSKTSNVPSMNNSDWFENQVSKDFKLFIGIAICSFSTILFLFAIIFLSVMINSRAISGFQIQTQMPIVKETVKSSKPIIKEVTDMFTKEEDPGKVNNKNLYEKKSSSSDDFQYCKYCGKKISKSSLFCPYCGNLIQ